MRLRTFAALTLMALEGACGRRTMMATSPPPPPSPSMAAAAAARPPVYIGRWAVAEGSCARAPWVLTSDALKSPSVLSCSFVKVEPTSAGYTVLGSCAVGKAEQPSRLVFTITGEGPAQSLTLTGGPFPEPFALTRCREDQASAVADGTG